MYDYEQYIEPEYYEQLRPTVQAMTPEDLDYSDQMLTAVVVRKYVTDHIEYRRDTGESVQSPHHTQEVGYGDCEDQTILANSMLKAGGVETAFIVVYDGVGATGHILPLVAFPDEPQDEVGETLTDLYLEGLNQIVVSMGYEQRDGLNWFYADPTGAKHIGDASGLEAYFEDTETGTMWKEVLEFEIC